MKKQMTRKLTYLALMVALDFTLASTFRIEGMAPMSSVMNILAVYFMSSRYAVAMAVICACLRMLLLGIPILALTGSFFGVVLAALLYKVMKHWIGAVIGEIIGTGIIAAIISYPAMMLTKTNFSGEWLMYVPRFFGATIIATVIVCLVYPNLKKVPIIKKMQNTFR